MKKTKASISKADKYNGIGAFWDTHDLGDYWEQGKDVAFEVNVNTEVTYYALEKNLSEAIQSAARRHGVTSDTLVNMWLQEKIMKELVA